MKNEALSAAPAMLDLVLSSVPLEGTPDPRSITKMRFLTYSYISFMVLYSFADHACKCIADDDGRCFCPCKELSISKGLFHKEDIYVVRIGPFYSLYNLKSHTCYQC